MANERGGDKQCEQWQLDCRQAFVDAGFWPNEVMWQAWLKAWTLGRESVTVELSPPSHVATPAQGETPRTDALCQECLTTGRPCGYEQLSPLCRQLERELAAAKQHQEDRDRMYDMHVLVAPERHDYLLDCEKRCAASSTVAPEGEPPFDTLEGGFISENIHILLRQSELLEEQGVHDVTARVLRDAARILGNAWKERERYRKGMDNWKRTAEAKDALVAPSATGTSDLERFYERICEIAMKRQQGYAERRHGGVLNGECMDEVVEVCKEASGARLRESIKATDGGTND